MSAIGDLIITVVICYFGLGLCIGTIVVVNMDNSIRYKSWKEKAIDIWTITYKWPLILFEKE